MSRSGATKLAVIALLSASVGGCEGVLGIEDAELDPEFEAAGTSACEVYCSTVADSCTGDDAVFTNRNTCLAFCERLPIGNDGDTTGNSVACRVAQAELAAATGEPEVHCPLAGPGGEGTCGDNCESYCGVFADVCTTRFAQGYADVADCIDACGIDIPDLGSFDTSMDEGDSVQCRLWHLSAAAVNPTHHCIHADGEIPCVD